MEKVKSYKNDNSIITIIKGVIYSIIASMILILLFALVIRFIDLSEKFVMPINQVIKLISIFTGCVLVLKDGKKGMLKGALIGLFYAIFSYAVFSLLSENLSVGLTTFTDLVFGTLIGGLCGLITVNMKK